MRKIVVTSGKDYTSTYGATQFDGNLTPRIHSRLKGVKNCILDGEMCGYDPELQVLGMFPPELYIDSCLRRLVFNL